MVCEERYYKSYMQFNQLKIRCYSLEEIKKLSVVELNQTKTFDEAGFPVKNGLYDAALGTTTLNQICETCGLKGNNCPGHYGHMQLSVPTFNPLFFSFTFNLMKASCIHCHRFTCNSGKNNEDNVDEIANFLKNFSSLPDDIIKNNIENRHFLMQTFLKEKLFKRRIKCPICKRSNGILRNDVNRAFILDFTTGLSSIREKNKNIKLKESFADNVLELENEFTLEENHKNIDEKKILIKTDEISDVNSVLDPLKLSEKFLTEQLNNVINGKCNKLIWRAAEVREHFRILWRKERLILETLFAIFKVPNNCNFHPTDFLFCQTILVQPSKFRPQRFLRGESYEHPITANYRRVMEADQLLTVVKIVMADNNNLTQEASNLLRTKVIGRSLNEKMHNAYLDLQMRVNCLFDQEADKYNMQQHPGLRQIIEKKEGIFRMNMMGKRVDYACRSVITPDPYLDVDEIGIPELFARRLTFSEPTNFLNISKLRKLIRKGPLEYPGANFVQLKGNFKQILPSVKEKIQERIAIAKRLTPGITKNNDILMPSHVFRHLERGDYLLMNRQPSLHKPSIMGHRARILKGQKALRMNYAPCKAYNADFDGDEMNGHFLQNRIAQSEASELANVANNYLVPKDGFPILGLIQDHVVSGVLLTLRDRFLSKELFMHLVLSAFAETTNRIKIPFPTMLKPKLLWTGKQVISTILINSIPVNKPKIHLSSKAKTPLSCWKVRGVESNLMFDMSESQVIIREGELLCGVLDKEHYGATQYGLIHSCYELYGPKIATKILSCLSRLFTTYLQHHGFTLGVADILVTKEADKFRRKKIRELRLIGPQVVEKTFNLTSPTSQQIEHVLASAYNNPRKDKNDVKQLDFTMKQVLAKYNEQINNSCVPNGLVRCFPDNALQMMIQCGAKGSMVNSIQISCALGQIELEGQRPSLSATGRSLPSFKCFDPSPRAGGFVDQRFLTGLQPQELFFHTMAGREGLIDTAVKTSRSGYLQRCIIKHLEGIYVRYDQTVRDHDGSVVQFRYGEDGLDIGRASFITPKQFKFLHENSEAVINSAMPSSASYCDWNVKKAEKYFKRLLKCKKKLKIAMEEKNEKIFYSSFLNFCKNQDESLTKKQLVKKWFKMSKEEQKLLESDFKKYTDSVDVKFNSNQTLGALPEKLLEQIFTYVKSNNLSQNFQRTLFWKGMRAFVEPGENVGLLAAQSIGEPSTQMTLNTFHFAGRGEMNVTLGIPRLREILMTSGKNILTPITEVVIRDNVSEEDVEKLKIDLNPVVLKDVLKNFILEEHIECGNGKLWRCYTLTLEILKAKHRKIDARFVKRNQILYELERRFFKEVAVGINKRFKDVLEHQQIQHRRLKNITKLSKIDDEGDIDFQKENEKKEKKKNTEASSDEEDDENTKDGEEIRLKKRHQDDGAEYEGEEEENKDQIKNCADENINEFYGLEDNDDYETEEELSDELFTDKNNPNMEKQKFAFKKSGDLSKIVAKANKSSVNNERIQEVLKMHQIISDYIYDSKNSRWCSIKFQVPLKNETKLDIMAVITSIVQKFVVFQIPGIEKAIIREEQRKGKSVKVLQVQGVNIEALYSRVNILDVNTLYSNDINFMLNKYGIEACGQTIAKEMNNVFSVYGIEVNFRHLSLTADFITFTGEVKPFSRGAMASNASPLQKMSFETTANFLRDSIITGQPDNLCSPSARLVTGQLHRGGTGSFELLQNAAYLNLLSKRLKTEIKNDSF